MITKRPGFTLVELIVAVLIFGFMMTSLATIYSTSNRYMFQNYRANITKSNVGIAMKAIQNTLSMATRIDQPAYGSTGNVLAFAQNVDQVSGCYPITNSAPASWHYFCLAADPDPAMAGQWALFYHTGTINLAGTTACGSATPSTWTQSYPAFCGFGGGGTVTILMKNVDTSSYSLFSRASGAPYLVTEKDIVRVILRSNWQPSARGFGQNGAQRAVDYTMDSIVKASVPGQ
jgi:prepilin-type N-terminal cleavage/methylation domain-containing protein